MTNKISCYLFAAALVCCAAFAHSQVPVAMAPTIHFQFFDSNGSPLAGGKIFTYAAGTTTLLNTYVDASGVSQNSDPIILDATGSPANGSVETGIFLANNAYKFVAFDSANVLQWSVDNISSYFGLLNSANTWTATQTFTLAPTILATDNQLVIGTPGNQTTLDFPPPAGNVTLHFPNIADTVVGRATTDNLTNKTLTNPLFNSSGCGIVNGPGTYICPANANPTGPTLNALAKFINAPSQATIAATTDTSGILGVCVANCTNTGNATIQQSGTVSCIFDGATVANDYVQISPTTAGDCHDAGTSPPSGQNLGQVTSTNSGAGTYQIALIPPGGLGQVRTLCADSTFVTVSANTNAIQAIKTCPIPAGALNAVGKAIRITASIEATPNSSTLVDADLAFGANASLTSGNIPAAFATTASSSITAFVSTCVVTTAGASGSLRCDGLVTSNLLNTGLAIFAPSGTVDLTAVLYVGSACQFLAASSSNACLGDQLIVEQLN